MSDTPITDKAFDIMTEIPKDLWNLRESMRNLERQRAELLKACMMMDKAMTEQQVDKALDFVKAAIAKSKGEKETTP